MNHKLYVLTVKQVLINTDRKVFYIGAGGGQTGFVDLSTRPGASKVLIGGIVPYAKEITINLLGKEPDNYVSKETARKLAVKARDFAKLTADNGIGIGFTSSSATENERVGRKHRCFVCITSNEATLEASLELNQGETREFEENVYSSFISIQTLAFIKYDDVSEIVKEFVDILKSKGIYVSNSSTYTEAHRYNNIFTDEKHVLFTNVPHSEDLVAIFPGSFDPFHDGHMEMVTTTKKLLGVDPVLEICVKNVDKPPLDHISIEERDKQLDNLGFARIFTATPTFVEKIKLSERLFPGKTKYFVIGMDTWNRIVNPKYGYTVEQLREIFNQHGIKFIVFNRDDEPFMELSLFMEFTIPEYNTETLKFRKDISSSVIRKEKNKNESR